MASFAPWAAALAGFRLVRERPLAVLAWAGVLFASNLASLALVTAMSGPNLPALEAAMNAKTIDPRAVSVAYEAVAPGYLAGAALALPFFAVVATAIYRAYLRPDEARAGFLRVGRQELAMLGLIVGLDLLLMTGIFVTVGLIATVSAAVAGASPDAGQALQFAGLTAAVLGAIWVMVRLCLAWPMTFQERRIRLFGSWSQTREQGWALLGAFVMGEGLMLLVFILLMTMAMGLGGAATLLTGGKLEQMGDSLKAPTVLIEMLRPLPLFFLAVESLFWALTLTTIVGVVISAYRTVRPPPSDDPVTRVWQ